MKVWQKYTIYAIPLLIAGALLIYFSDIVTYIILAWVVSMIGAPIHRRLSKSKYIGSGMAAGLTLALFGLFCMLTIMLFIPPLLDQAKNLAGLDYQKIVKGLEEPIGDVEAWFAEKGLMAPEMEIAEVAAEPKNNAELQTTVIRLDSLLKSQGDTLSDTGIDLVINVNNPQLNEPAPVKESDDWLIDVRDNIFEKFNPAQIPKILGSFFGFFSNILITLLSVFFIAFFFLKEKGLFSRMASTLVPNGQEGKTSKAIDDSSKLLVRYFVGLITQAFVITVITSLVLKLLGVHNALLMAFCFAIFNLIPFIGPILGNLFGALIVVSSNLDASFYDVMLPMITKSVIVFAAMQLFDNFFLQPTIFGRSVKAHPLEIFLVVLMGAKIGGVLGMVIAIPAYTVLRVIAKVFFSEFEVVKRLTAGL